MYVKERKRLKRVQERTSDKPYGTRPSSVFQFRVWFPSVTAPLIDSQLYKFVLLTTSAPASPWPEMFVEETQIRIPTASQTQSIPSILSHFWIFPPSHPSLIFSFYLPCLFGLVVFSHYVSILKELMTFLIIIHSLRNEVCGNTSGSSVVYARNKRVLQMHSSQQQ